MEKDMFMNLDLLSFSDLLYFQMVDPLLGGIYSIVFFGGS